jgi:hypothetical protein
VKPPVTTAFCYNQALILLRLLYLHYCLPYLWCFLSKADSETSRSPCIRWQCACSSHCGYVASGFGVRVRNTEGSHLVWTLISTARGAFVYKIAIRDLLILQQLAYTRNSKSVKTMQAFLKRGECELLTRILREGSRIDHSATRLRY